jgi:hypothetical protein
MILRANERLPHEDDKPLWNALFAAANVPAPERTSPYGERSR